MAEQNTTEPRSGGTMYTTDFLTEQERIAFVQRTTVVEYYA